MMRDARRRQVIWETVWHPDRSVQIELKDEGVFHLASGRLILLRTRGERRDVRQFDIDLRKYTPDKQGLKQLSRHPKVREFFQSTSRPSR